MGEDDILQRPLLKSSIYIYITSLLFLALFISNLCLCLFATLYIVNIKSAFLYGYILVCSFVRRP